MPMKSAARMRSRTATSPCNSALRHSSARSSTSASVPDRASIQDGPLDVGGGFRSDGCALFMRPSKPAAVHRVSGRTISNIALFISRRESVVDEKDFQILSHLARDPFVSNERLGRDLGLSGHSVKRRIEKLVEEGVLPST